MAMQKHPTTDTGVRTLLDKDRTGLAVRIGQVADLAGGNVAIARTCNVSESVVRKWRRGESQPVTLALVAMARAASVSISWLATGEGSMRPGDAGAAENSAIASAGDAAKGGAWSQETTALLAEAIRVAGGLDVIARLADYPEAQAKAQAELAAGIFGLLVRGVTVDETQVIAGPKQ